MWGQICTESSYQLNFNFGFSTYKSDILLHLSQWQYWWWFWFSFFWTFYYFLILRTVKNRTTKMNPKINTSLRGRGKWGDFLIAVLPLSWCANILLNSNFILRMFEWQNESSLFTVRIHGKQWYWVYKFDLIDAIDILTVPRNVGNNRWIVGTPEELTVCESYLQAIQLRAQEDWIKNYWHKKIQDDIKAFKLAEISVVNKNINKNHNNILDITYEQPNINYSFLKKRENTLKLNNLLNLKFNIFEKKNILENVYNTISDHANYIRSKTKNYFYKEFSLNKKLKFEKKIVDTPIMKALVAFKVEMLHAEFSWEFINFRKDIWRPISKFNPNDIGVMTPVEKLKAIFYLFRHFRRFVNTYEPEFTLKHNKILNLQNTDLSEFYDEDNMFDINFFDDSIFDNLYYNYDELDDTWDVDNNMRHQVNPGPLRITKHLLTPEYLKENSDLLKFNFYESNNETSPKVADNGNFWVLKQKRYKRKQLINPSKKKDVEYMSFDAVRNIYRKHIIENIKLITDMDFQMDSYSLFKCVRGNKHRTESLPIHLYRRLLRTKKTLVLPAHINMTVVTNSYDVVHSWFLPGLGLKMDCVPGRSTHHSLYLDNIGFYYGQCAEICGRYHHHMPIRLCALPFEHFLVWWQIKGLPKLLRIKKEKKEIINHNIFKYTW